MNSNKSNLLSSEEIVNTFKGSDDHVSLEQIKSDINILYNKLCAELVALNVLFTEDILNKTAALIYDDLYARVKQDPIAITPFLIYTISKSFKVIFYYRIANAVSYFNHEDFETSKICKYYSYLLSEVAAKDTKIEIHPEAIIGERFVIDHGVNTVIGATSIIGNDCTILNNVLLGAKKITCNPKGKRHPTIGNNVNIAGGVRILGAVSIGDNTQIGPDCMIINNIPSNSTVRKESSCQIIKRNLL
ncbi:serine acetyltransferase [Kordia sp. YSTF-M3]|uniref:Serine acetyltransferase n=1 Tax=Kordia aestuariivivens TaxID=2759037 RepID=A0ABR7QE82_9FLAO|nr:serine acetyltransferase [Kordia aestuariivivens]MBC8756866.1 serine acetyltransferase [Kordia aestuariivivens]